MKKIKVLMFVDWFWPGYRAGGPIQSCTNLALGIRDEVQISVVTSNCDFGQTGAYTNVESDTWNEVLDGIRVFYASKEFLNYKNIKRLIKKEEFDFIYLNSMFSLPFTIWPLRYARKRCPEKIVLAPRGMLAEGALSVKPRKKKIFLSLFRKFGSPKKIRFHATSPHEVTAIRMAFGRRMNIFEAPNLPDFQKYDWKPREKESGTLKVISIARISPEKNTLFLISSLGEVKEKLSVHLYGPISDKKYWKKCQQRIEKLPKHIKVKYKGELESRQVKETLINYHLFYLPTLGENFGHAIFEALSHGLPILISDRTMWNNLKENHAGFGFSLSDGLKFTEAISDFVHMDENTYQLWSKGAWKYAHDFLDNTALLSKSINLFSPE